MIAKTDTGIDAKDRAKVAAGLSKVLADAYAVYLKTHGYHWNVRGTDFRQLHLLFEEQYNEQWTALDDIAERIRALGEFAPQGYATFANLTSIKDGDAEKDSAGMVEDLLNDHETLCRTAREVLEVADEGGDDVSVDLLTQRLTAHEKHAWMLRASLGRK